MKNKRKYEEGGATAAEATAKKRLKQLQKKMSRNSVAISRPDFSARAKSVLRIRVQGSSCPDPGKCIVKKICR
jgi:hypothetical protein